LKQPRERLCGLRASAVRGCTHAPPKPISGRRGGIDYCFLPNMDLIAPAERAQLDPGLRDGQIPWRVRKNGRIVMSEATGPGIVLQPEEGASYWQPRWANGYSIVKLSPKHAGPDNIAMGIQVIAPGGYVREHSHMPNQEILFCFAGNGTILVDGVPHPFVPGTTVYAGPGVRHKIINDGPDDLKMTWTYLPPGLDDFFAAIGRPRRPGEPAPETFERPADVHAIEARTGYGPPIEG
jgi:quercetin dioxygenase-like cupin family protein